MTFLNPGFLWAFALALPLIAVYLLKIKPRRTPVTAFFLWDRVLVERRSSALFRRLRGLLSLLLMLAALSALALAAARPQLPDRDRRDLIILIDNSASMSGRLPGGRTRLDEARDEARSLLASVSEDRRAAVGALSDRLVMLCALSDDLRSLRRAVDAVEPTALDTPRGVLSALSGVDQIDDRLRVVLISDAVGERYDLPPGIELLKIDTGPDFANAGFIAADILKGVAADEVRVFFQVAATEALNGVDAEVSLLRGGVLLKIIPLTLRAGVNEPVSATATGAAGRYELRLHVPGPHRDADPGDDTAVMVAHDPRPIRVAVSDSARYFFENAVAAFERSEGLVRLVAPDEPAEIALVRGSDSAASTPPPASIVFAPAAGSRWMQTSGDALATPIPRLVAPNHPAFRFVPVESLRFDGAHHATLPVGAAVLVEDHTGVPLVWQLRDEHGAGIVFNLDPAAGDFFLSPYFPLIVRGAAAYVAGRSDTVHAVYPTGARVEPAGLRPGDSALLTEPGAAEPRPLAPAELVPLDRPGYYLIHASSDDWTFAAAQLHRGETLSAVAGPAAALEGLERGTPIWKQLVILALLLLVAEELLYHRRRVD